MPVWGNEFYLLVLKVSLTGISHKIRFPARPCTIIYFLSGIS